MEYAYVVIEGCTIAKEVRPKIVKISCTDTQDDEKVVARYFR